MKACLILVIGLAGLWCAVCIQTACISTGQGRNGHTNWAEERFRDVSWGRGTLDFTNTLAAVTAEEWEQAGRLVNPNKDILYFTSEEGTQVFQILNLDITNVIHTATELAQFAHLVNHGDNFYGRVVILASDVDLSAHQWTPIGTNSTVCFKGIFDGKGHTISGMTVNVSGEYSFDCIGLFGEVHGSIIRNMTFADVNISVFCGGGTFPVVGGIAGSSCGIISNCTVNGAISSSFVAGGIAGSNRYGISGIMDCVNDAAVSAVSVTGGIVGWNSCPIWNCRNNGTVSCSSDIVSPKIGGIAGNNDGLIVNCLNNGTVRSFSYSDARVGGLVGENNIDRIINSLNRGTVYVRTDSAASEVEEVREQGADSRVGGIVGRHVGGNIVNCVNVGDITGTGTRNDRFYIGGIIGDNDVSISKITKSTDNYWRTSGMGQAIGTNKAGTATSNLIGFGDAPGTLSSPHPVFGTTSLLDALNAYVDAHPAATNIWDSARTNAIPLLKWALGDSPDGYPSLHDIWGR